MHIIVKNDSIFDWVEILSCNLMNASLKFKLSKLDSPLKFYMSSYLLDIIGARNEFRAMGWC